MDNGVTNKLSEIFSDVFDFRGEINTDMKRTDIPNWDSVQHVTLVEALENTFGIHLSMDEMIELQDMSSIINVLSRHGVS
jgi:acyl carrier protein